MHPNDVSQNPSDPTPLFYSLNLAYFQKTKCVKILPRPALPVKP